LAIGYRLWPFSILLVLVLVLVLESGFKKGAKGPDFSISAFQHLFKVAYHPPLQLPLRSCFQFALIREIRVKPFCGQVFALVELSAFQHLFKINTP